VPKRRQGRQGPTSVTKPPPLSVAPTPERAAHAEGITPPVVNGVRRPWWTIRTRLDGLLIEKLIDERAHKAALAFERDFALLTVSSRDSFSALRTGRIETDRHVEMRGRIDAVMRLRLAQARLGPDAFGLIIAVVVVDESWRALERRFARGRQTVKAMAAEAITALVEGDPREE